jgi:hypothetical protein
MTFSVLALFIMSAKAQTCMVGNYAGTGTVGFSGDDGDAASATFSISNGGVWVDTSKKLFIADYNNNRIRAVNPNTKIVTTIAGWFFFFLSLLFEMECCVYFSRNWII